MDCIEQENDEASWLELLKKSAVFHTGEVIGDEDPGCFTINPFKIGASVSIFG